MMCIILINKDSFMITLDCGGDLRGIFIWIKDRYQW